MQARLANRQCLKVLMMVSISGALMLGCSSASSGSSAQVVVSSPTPDSVTQNYVALIHNYWIRQQAADEASKGSNFAARVCLGVYPLGAPSSLQFINPQMCRERAVAILNNQQQFLSDLDSTPPPPKFAADDQAFRTQLSKAVVDLKALISAAATGSKEAVLQAAAVYSNDMVPTVTDALNDVDPSVVHP